MTIEELGARSASYRKDVLTFIYESGAGHTGGSLSCVDILNVLYNHVMDITPENWDSLDRDVFIQSKGHSVEALYVVLADLGFFPRSELQTGNRFGTRLIGHPTRDVPGIEHNTGGLGHGLSVAVGRAIASNLDRRTNRVYCLLGDGELAEGSNWEAAMTAAHYTLGNLVAIVDRNGLQITGRTRDVNEIEPLAAKWEAFGWQVHEADGNSIGELVRTFDTLPRDGNRPNVVIARTVKGKGVSFIENQTGWHHHVPTAAEYEQAMAEVEVKT
jgi:transketolase